MPTRYESVGCDDGAFRVPKEYEAFGESHDTITRVYHPDGSTSLRVRLLRLLRSLRETIDITPEVSKSAAICVNVSKFASKFC